MGTLYLVATPIGNLEDITVRARRVLGEVSLIAAEDTRHTRKLLAHYDIHTRLTSYFEHNKLAKLDTVLRALDNGDVALVSDAGTPALNDPGYELVRAVLEAGHKVSPLPGPSAPLAALIASGLPTDSFLYLGYLPRKSVERQRALEAVREQPYTLIFLEAPHRLIATLRDLLDVLGERQIAVARELTKLHEEIFRSGLSQAVQHFEQNPPRGEITLVVSGQLPHVIYWDAEQLEAVLPSALASGEPLGRLAARLSAESGWPRRKVYQMLLELQQNSGR
jgi:16S rRNA (cytidine1402-2'-O)-methyltransferase